MWKCGEIGVALRALEFRRCVRKLHCRTPSDPFYRFSHWWRVCMCVSETLTARVILDLAATKNFITSECFANKKDQMEY